MTRSKLCDDFWRVWDLCCGLSPFKAATDGPGTAGDGATGLSLIRGFSLYMAVFAEYRRLDAAVGSNGKRIQAAPVAAQFLIQINDGGAPCLHSAVARSGSLLIRTMESPGWLPGEKIAVEQKDKPQMTQISGRFSRRTVMLALGGVAAAAAGAMAFPGLFGSNTAKAGEVLVYKSPSCGCCGQWVTHLRRNGFAVSVRNIDNISPVKEQAGVPYDLESCHTAFVGGYVVEGHVPAQDIHNMLAERSDIRGLAVPGMPIGSPGMEDADPEPYTVYSFDGQGRAKAYAAY